MSQKRASFGKLQFRQARNNLDNFSASFQLFSRGNLLSLCLTFTFYVCALLLLTYLLTTRLADLGSCTDCQQGGLLQLGSRRIPGQLQDRLQSVLNAAARLVYSARRSERITPLLRELHWLRVPERVTFRGCAFWLTAVFMEQRRRTLLRACTGHLTSTLDVVCALLTQPC